MTSTATLPLAGRSALVTGGGSGIGLGCARRLADEGAVVTICGRSEERLKEAVAAIGRDSRYVVCDVSDEDQDVYKRQPRCPARLCDH